ncbi:CPBP family intramembrane glutamic endopeptidase [Natrialbaceae archaeon A-chndr2]
METADRSGTPIRSVFVAIGLTIAGIFTAELLTLPTILVDSNLMDAPTETSRALRTVFFTLNFLGFFVAGAVYLWWTERDWSFVNLKVPSTRGIGIAIAGVGISLVFLFAMNAVSIVLEIPSSENSVMNFIGTDPTMVLIMIAIVFLFNAPAEEFLFRGVIQTRLYAAFSKSQAVVITSVIFAVVHLPAYALAADGSLEPTTAIAFSLVVVFGGSIIFGYLYAVTDNLFVPTIAHAGFNAFQFGMLYLVLRFGDEEDVDAITSSTLDSLTTILEFVPTVLEASRAMVLSVPV